MSEKNPEIKIEAEVRTVPSGAHALSITIHIGSKSDAVAITSTPEEEYPNAVHLADGLRLLANQIEGKRPA